VRGDARGVSCSPEAVREAVSRRSWDAQRGARELAVMLLIVALAVLFVSRLGRVPPEALGFALFGGIVI
jgi:hypothetical protein